MQPFLRLISVGFVAAMLAAMPLAAPIAQAQEMAIPAKPLVVIRFNQPKVYYDQQLYGAIAQAVGIKPEVMFDVVSYAPSGGDSAVDAKWQQMASYNTQRVVASMQSMGIPLERIRVTGQSQAGLRYDETHVFVR